MTKMTLAPLALVVLGCFLGNSSVQAQPFGLNEQTLTLGAASFRPASGANTGYSYDISTDGYLHGDGQYVAPLELPEEPRSWASAWTCSAWAPAGWARS